MGYADHNQVYMSFEDWSTLHFSDLPGVVRVSHVMMLTVLILMNEPDKDTRFTICLRLLEKIIIANMKVFLTATHLKIYALPLWKSLNISHRCVSYVYWS